MDFVREASSKILGSDAGGEAEHKKEETEHKKEGQQHTPSTSELMSSAKVVVDATKAKMNKQEYDEGKAAKAAADILDGAQHYGKLDETQGLGKMIEQAEDYLHKHSTTTTPASAHAGDAPQPTTTPATQESSGGYGQYVKMAEGLLNKDEKKPEEGEEKSGGGLMKMAGSFLK